MEVEARVVLDPQQVVVELALVEAADAELVRQQELRGREANARAAAGYYRYLAVAEGVDLGGGLEGCVWGGVVEHYAGLLGLKAEM